MDERTDSWITILTVGAVTGLYGFFIRHLIKHVNRDDLEKKQDTTACEQIVRRLDENHAETCRKLDRVLDYLEKGGPNGRVRT